MNVIRRDRLILVLAIVASFVPTSCDRSVEARHSALRRLGNAVVNYRDGLGRYPPAVVVDEVGRPMHGWRVLLLPFVEANAFTAEYDASVPWDDPANADLADGSRVSMGKKFPHPADVRRVYRTSYDRPVRGDFHTEFLAVLSGDEEFTPYDGLFDPSRGRTVRAPTDLGEFMIVAVDRSNVHWMEPRDIVLSAPTPPWGIAVEDVKDDIVASAVVTGAAVEVFRREETLRLLDRRSRTAAVSHSR